MKSDIRFIVVVIVLGLLIAVVLLLRIFVVQTFFVQGMSMEPTYETQDYVWVNKLAYKFSEPEKDDIVIVFYAGENISNIKRIIGLPEETVEFEGESFEVPEGKYFLLGDNPDWSYDSRTKGLVSKEDFIGKVFAKKPSFSKMSRSIANFISGN